MIFADANFLIALFVKDHKFNKRALKIWNKINHETIIISNSIILEVMTVLNIKLKVSKELLEKVYNRLNSGKFGIVEDINLYNNTMERMVNYLPKRLPFFDCLYIEIMKELGINKIVTFDEHFNIEDIKIID
ncbi:hypothetical protein MARBORIA2_11240 [Methanobrevibacter arboriphilus]|jgi:predicted nucleic acid-binding protein|uniref:Uncharacterized protein n=1 Tax=Methanobrevibacter arboriphilus TaxID=39441 RepID=A0ACA8R606_METAZ|nr:type II toxin-antitoxin system VapC family toxin [Methanobrevibacter arboriphilus]MCC7561391.1 type II toxin-antitoxin system VapC family toxin [Methanobrevibacter arboriphilus]BBL62792.1 hypothetical protein MarbSA_18320 [Methanobrevibacter arboriphilus]GLI12034.1 hypothetical protein MARBORIA2_11240 [Methanobrevibacter arboriphilus]